MIIRAPMGQLVETEIPFQRLYIGLLDHTHAAREVL